MDIMQGLFWLCFALASAGYLLKVYSWWRSSRQKPKEPERWYEGEELGPPGSTTLTNRHSGNKNSKL